MPDVQIDMDISSTYVVDGEQLRVERSRLSIACRFQPNATLDAQLSTLNAEL